MRVRQQDNKAKGLQATHTLAESFIQLFSGQNQDVSGGHWLDLSCNLTIQLYTLGIDTFDTPGILKQCCGSVTFWYGSGSAPLTNGSGFKLHNLHHFSKIKVTKKLSSFFLIFLLDDRRIPIGSVPNGSRSEKHKDPTDPDPQHCSKRTASGLST